MWAVGFVGDKSAAMVGAGGADSIRRHRSGAHYNRPTHAIPHGAALTPRIHSCLFIQPIYKGVCVRLVGFGRQVSVHGHHFLAGRFILKARAHLDNWRLRIAVVGVDT